MFSNLLLFVFSLTSLQISDVDGGSLRFYEHYKPTNFFDCLYDYFQCTEDETFGEFPMNRGLCLKSFVLCDLWVKKNKETIVIGNVTITQPAGKIGHITAEERKFLVRYPRENPYPSNYIFIDRICSHFNRTLSCEGNGNLVILDVLYGRTKKSACPKEENKYHHENCIVTQPTDPIFDSCQGKPKCFLGTYLMDPGFCEKQNPYLEIKYTCTSFPKPSASGIAPQSPSTGPEKAINIDFATPYISQRSSTPWLRIDLDKLRKVKGVFVFPLKGEEYIPTIDLEVKIFIQSQVPSTGFVSQQTDTVCIKTGPWNLHFKCLSFGLRNGVQVYSNKSGVLGIKEVVIVLENKAAVIFSKPPGEDGESNTPQ